MAHGFQHAMLDDVRVRSKTLICTDALVYVPEDPPAVLDKDELKGAGIRDDLRGIFWCEFPRSRFGFLSLGWVFAWC